MTDSCAECRHFDQDDTSLQVCLLHKKYTHADWTCGDFEKPKEGGSDATKV